MNEVVERVARALANKMTGWEPDWPTYQYAARAAIEAIREPTGAMVTAAYDHSSGEGIPETMWAVMIDAALKEPA